MFPLGELEIIDGNYAAVVSSRGYPNVDKTQRPRIFINKIPSGVFITYTLLTSAKKGFKRDQFVAVHGHVARDIFNASLTSPFSHHRVTRGEISIHAWRNTDGVRENPVFLLQYSGT